MATKSPTHSVKSREVIGVDQFSQRRDVFDKHATVFMPLPSPPGIMPVYKEAEPIVTSNHGKTTSNFKRNAPGYSSMRESRTEDRNIEFRARKYSDNFTSELNQSDDADYRYSMTERTRRLSKLRKDFLNSNLHEPSNDSPFARTGARASMPTSSSIRYKIESPNLYKFPFAEPYATPPPARRVFVDLGPPEVNGEKENLDPEVKPRNLSKPDNNTSPKVDKQKLYEELIKRYSPQRKPIDWKLPPTRPRVVGSVPKSTSSAAESVDGSDKKPLDGGLNKYDDDVFVKSENNIDGVDNSRKEDESVKKGDEQITSEEVKRNGPIASGENSKENDSKSSITELEEKNDEVPELSALQRSGKESARKPSLDKYTDISIPELIDKMTVETDDIDKTKHETKKVKRKRSFLDKLLGRKKDKSQK